MSKSIILIRDSGSKEKLWQCTCQNYEHWPNGAIFGESLENILIDCLVVGIDNKVIQRRLLSETPLMFKKVLEPAQSLEAAAKNLREIRNSITGIKNGRSGGSLEGLRTE